MPEASLVDDVDQQSTDHQRRIVLETLSKPEKGAKTLKDIVEQLGDHSIYGPIAMALTLDDLYHARQLAHADDEPEIEVTSPSASPAKGNGVSAKGKGKKAAAKKTPKKAAKAKSKAKSKSGGKPKTAAKADDSGRKRVNWDDLQKEIMAFMKQTGEPVQTGAICDACSCSPVQARKAIDMLIEKDKVQYEGEGRGRKYALA